MGIAYGTQTEEELRIWFGHRFLIASKVQLGGLSADSTITKQGQTIPMIKIKRILGSTTYRYFQRVYYYYTYLHTIINHNEEEDIKNLHTFKQNNASTSKQLLAFT